MKFRSKTITMSFLINKNHNQIYLTLFSEPIYDYFIHK